MQRVFLSGNLLGNLVCVAVEANFSLFGKVFPVVDKLMAYVIFTDWMIICVYTLLREHY